MVWLQKMWRISQGFRTTQKTVPCLSTLPWWAEQVSSCFQGCLQDMHLLPFSSPPSEVSWDTDALQVSAGLEEGAPGCTFRDHLVPISSSDSSSPSQLRAGQHGLHVKGCWQAYQLQLLGFLFFRTVKKILKKRGILKNDLFMLL